MNLDGRAAWLPLLASPPPPPPPAARPEEADEMLEGIRLQPPSRPLAPLRGARVQAFHVLLPVSATDTECKVAADTWARAAAAVSVTLVGAAAVIAWLAGDK